MLKVSFGSGALGPASGGDFSWTDTPQTLTWSRSDTTMTVSVLVNIHETVLLTAMLSGMDYLCKKCSVCQSGMNRPCRMYFRHPHFLPNRLCHGVDLEFTWSRYVNRRS